MKITFGKKRKHVVIPQGYRLLKISDSLEVRAQLIGFNGKVIQESDLLFNHGFGTFDVLGYDDTHDFDGKPITLHTADYTAVLRKYDERHPEWFQDDSDEEINYESLND